jgi:predicted TIM-barrel fold metal-dependent hydrolase
VVIDLNGRLFSALELVYEQSRPELRGLWQERVDPYLRIQTHTRPDLGDWVRPWLELTVDPVEYLHREASLHRHRLGTEEPGMLQDRPSHRLAAMDRAGVDAIVLHPDSFAGPAAAMSDVDLAAGLLAGYNRYLGTYCRLDPARLTGSIQLHGLQSAWSLLEIQRLAGRSWVAGAAVQLPADIPVSDSRVAPVLAALAAADLPLFHRSELFDAPRFPGHDDLWGNPELAATLGPVWDAQRYLTDLVLNSVLDEHPGLRVCTLDGGVGWLPAWLERLHDVSPPTADAARDLLHNGRIVTTIAPYESQRTVMAVVESLGDRCVAWGSAFPHSEDQGPTAVNHWHDIPAEHLEQLLGRNALTLIGEAARTSIQR